MKYKESKLLILFSFLLFMWGIYLFHCGFHNVDVCHNERIIELSYDIDILEQRLDGGIWSLGECYLTGLTQLICGFYTAVVGAFLLGVFLWNKK